MPFFVPYYGTGDRVLKKLYPCLVLYMALAREYLRDAFLYCALYGTGERVPK